MLIKRGEVVRVLFPNSNLTMAKRRPALVIQADNLDTGLAQTVVAMITSKMVRANHPNGVTVMASSPAGVGAGLRLDSVIMTDNLVTVANAQINSVLGRLSMKDIDAALRHTFGL